MLSAVISFSSSRMFEEEKLSGNAALTNTIHGTVTSISSNCISISGCDLDGLTAGFLVNDDGDPVVQGGHVVQIGDTGIFGYHLINSGCGKYTLSTFTASPCD